MRLVASAFVLGIGGLGMAACDRVQEPLSAHPEPLTTTPSASAAPSRCVKTWTAKPKREAFVPGFVAPNCPEKGDADTPPAPKDPLRTATVVFHDAVSGGASASITVEVAESGNARQRGLMMRKSMPDNRGMLFVFEERRDHAFWMHNTCIPLDMMFIDKDGLIVGIEENVPTMNDDTYSVGCSSTYVLEVNAGWSRKHGVAPGQRVKMDGV
jgi:uncharacterized membrane protein (UPF0127 family)